MKIQTILMKKTSILFAAILLVGISWSTSLPAQTGSKTQYWVVRAYEARIDNYQQVNGSAVISNVVTINCPRIDRMGPRVGGIAVFNQFNEYYKAYYARSSGYSHLSIHVSLGPYTTWEQAERERRKLVANHNQRDRERPLLIERFSYLCNER